MTAGKVRITMQELGTSGIATRDRTLVGASLQLLAVVDLLSFGALIDAGVKGSLSRADGASTESQRMEIAASGGRVPLLGLSVRGPLVVDVRMSGAAPSYVVHLVSRFRNLRRDHGQIDDAIQGPRVRDAAARAIREMIDEDAPSLRGHIAASPAWQGLIERIASALPQVLSAVPLEANETENSPVGAA